MACFVLGNSLYLGRGSRDLFWEFPSPGGDGGRALFWETPFTWGEGVGICFGELISPRGDGVMGVGHCFGKLHLSGGMRVGLVLGNSFHLGMGVMGVGLCFAELPSPGGMGVGHCFGELLSLWGDGVVKGVWSEDRGVVGGERSGEWEYNIWDRGLEVNGGCEDKKDIISNIENILISL